MLGYFCAKFLLYNKIFTAFTQNMQNETYSSPTLTFWTCVILLVKGGGACLEEDAPS